MSHLVPSSCVSENEEKERLLWFQRQHSTFLLMSVSTHTDKTQSWASTKGHGVQEKKRKTGEEAKNNNNVIQRAKKHCTCGFATNVPRKHTLWEHAHFGHFESRSSHAQSQQAFIACSHAMSLTPCRWIIPVRGEFVAILLGTDTLYIGERFFVPVDGAFDIMNAAEGGGNVRNTTCLDPPWSSWRVPLCADVVKCDKQYAEHKAIACYLSWRKLTKKRELLCIYNYRARISAFVRCITLTIIPDVRCFTFNKFS